MYSPGVERALRAALDAHAGQTRKGGSIPYITHPLHVALILARTGAEEEAIQAGLLHDVVEDCEDWTLDRVESEFGPRVRGIVADLTEEKAHTWEKRKQAAVDHVAHMDAAALQVKAADKLHNLSSLLADLRAADDPPQVWAHFTATPEETLAMARALVEALQARLEGPLIAALVQTLAELEAFAVDS